MPEQNLPEKMGIPGGQGNFLGGQRKILGQQT
jgi:hypothetical protein